MGYRLSGYRIVRIDRRLNRGCFYQVCRVSTEGVAVAWLCGGGRWLSPYRQHVKHYARFKSQEAAQAALDKAAAEDERKAQQCLA